MSQLKVMNAKPVMRGGSVGAVPIGWSLHSMGAMNWLEARTSAAFSSGPCGRIGWIPPLTDDDSAQLQVLAWVRHRQGGQGGRRMRGGGSGHLPSLALRPGGRHKEERKQELQWNCSGTAVERKKEQAQCKGGAAPRAPREKREPPPFHGRLCRFAAICNCGLNRNPMFGPQPAP